MGSRTIDTLRTDTVDERPPLSDDSRAPSAGRKLITRTAWQIAVFVAVIAAWQLLVSTGVVEKFYISQPTDVIEKLREDLTTGDLYSNAWITLWEIILGMVIGGLGGTLVGFALGAVPRVYDAFSPFIVTLYTLPRVALISLFVLWFGIGSGSKIALVISLVFFSMLFNAYSGVRSIDPRLIDNLRLLGASRYTVIREIYVPGTAPWLFTGLRISLVFAVTGAVVGEMLASEAGLGHLLQQRTSLFDAQGIFSMLVLIAVLAMVLSGLVGIAERWAIRWRGESES